MDKQYVGPAILIGLVLIAIVGIVTTMLRGRNEYRRNGPPLVETGYIKEESSLTAGGALSLVALIINLIVCGLFASAAQTVFQEIEIGVAFLGGNMLWGLGVAVGRRRTYRTYRYEAEKPE
jgi:hypothetical protein